MSSKALIEVDASPYLQFLKEKVYKVISKKKTCTLFSCVRLPLLYSTVYISQLTATSTCNLLALDLCMHSIPGSGAKPTEATSDLAAVIAVQTLDTV
jgi:hypothetical protein